MTEPSGIEAAAFQPYRRKQIAELRPYIVGEDMLDISVSREDVLAGSPKSGDMIARNPKNHDDQWLVAAAYFADNFEPGKACPDASGDLRERIARAIWETHDGAKRYPWSEMTPYDREQYFIYADAILAVLPGRDEDAIRANEREKCAKAKEIEALRREINVARGCAQSTEHGRAKYKARAEVAEQRVKVLEARQADDLARAIRALSPEPASGEFVVVPREPTEAMIVAGEEISCASARDNCAMIYDAMLAAATKDGERA